MYHNVMLALDLPCSYGGSLAATSTKSWLRLRSILYHGAAGYEMRERENPVYYRSNPGLEHINGLEANTAQKHHHQYLPSTQKAKSQAYNLHVMWHDDSITQFFAHAPASYGYDGPWNCSEEANMFIDGADCASIFQWRTTKRANKSAICWK